MTTAGRPLLVLVLAAFALAGCSSAETTSPQPTQTVQTVSGAEEYCSLSAELDAQEGPPSEEQLAEIEAAAPSEISEDVATLVEAVRNQSFDDPKVQEAESALLAWEEENCVESLEVEPGEPGAEATDAPTP